MYKINPNGVVPTLVGPLILCFIYKLVFIKQIDGEDVIYESGAICLALAERFSEKNLAPPVTDTKARSQYYMWIVYATATIGLLAYRRYSGMEDSCLFRRACNRALLSKDPQEGRRARRRQDG